MINQVAVLTTATDPTLVKQYALLFPKLHIAAELGTIEHELPSALVADYTWLHHKGVLTWMPGEAYLRLAETWQNHKSVLFRRDNLSDAEWTDLATAVARQAVAEMREHGAIDAVVLASDAFSANSSRAIPSRLRPDMVCDVVIKALPLPDPLTSWDEILEFRADPANNGYLLKLHLWMLKAASGDSTLLELKMELEDMLNDYSEYMRIQKMKSTTGALETIVTGAAKAAENFVKLKWGDMSTLPFALRHRRLELMDAELKAPGREIGYVAKARQAFGDTQVRHGL